MDILEANVPHCVPEELDIDAVIDAIPTEEEIALWKSLSVEQRMAFTGAPRNFDFSLLAYAHDN